MASLDRNRFCTKGVRARRMVVINKRYSLGACPEMPERLARECEERGRNYQDLSAFEFSEARVQIVDPTGRLIELMGEVWRVEGRRYSSGMGRMGEA